jgi:hypothetical protein
MASESGIAVSGIAVSGMAESAAVSGALVSGGLVSGTVESCVVESVGDVVSFTSTSPLVFSEEASPASPASGGLLLEPQPHKRRSATQKDQSQAADRRAFMRRP